MNRLRFGPIRDWVGFAILGLVTILLFGYTIYDVWMLHSLGEVVVVLVMVGLVLGIYYESQNLHGTESTTISTKTILKRSALLICGALVSHTLKVNVGLGAVVSSSLVALIASLVLPAHAVPIYCGSFVGMTSSRLLMNHTELTYAAVVAAILFLLSERVFSGFGGKLGAVAFAGTFVTGFGLKRQFEITPVPEWSLLGSIIVFSIGAALITYWLNVHLGHGGVVASGIVGITGGLILPAVYPGEVGKTLAVMVMCASFAGMSSEKRFPRTVQMIAIGFVTGLFFVYSMPLAGGAGGKLGAIAFASGVAVRGHMELLKRLRLVP